MSDNSGKQNIGRGVNFPGRVQRSGTPDYVPPKLDYESLFGNTDAEFLSAIPKKTNYIRDLGVDSLNAVVTTGEAVAGLGRLAGLGKVLDAIDYRPGDAHEMVSDLYSDGRKATELEVQQAQKAREGSSFIDQAIGGAADYVRHPSLLVGGVVNSAPSMVLGGGGARMMATKLFSAAEAAALARGATALEARAAGQAAIDAAPKLLNSLGAAGEGAIATGQIAEQIHSKDPNGNIYAAIPAGIVTGLISRGMSAVPGIGDATTAALTGSRTAGATGNLLARGAKGIASEMPQEFLQSGQERMWQNIGTGDPLMEGVANDAGAGAIQGAAMGGAFGAFSKAHAPANTQTETKPSSIPELRPITYTSQGSLDLLGGEHSGVNPRDAYAGPLPRENSQIGMQASLGLDLSPPAYTGQTSLDLQGGEHSGVNPRDAFAGPLPAEPTQTGSQLPLDFRNRLSTENVDASAKLASAAESGALGKLDSFGNVLTPEQFNQQDNIANTLSAVSQNERQSEPLQVVGQQRPTLYEQKRMAQSKAAQGLLLSSYEANLLTQDIPAPESTSNIILPQDKASQPIAVESGMRARAAEPTQMDMFGAPLNRPVTPLTREGVTVNQADQSQIGMFDSKGNPTYQATQNESPRFNDMAQEAASFFGFKLTEKRAPLVEAIVKAKHEGNVDEDTHDMLLHMVRESKNAQAQRILDATIAAAQESQQLADAQEVAPAEEAPVQSTPAVQTQAESIAQDVPDEDPTTVKLKDLMRLHSEGLPVATHPNMSPYDAELELQRRLSTTKNEREADKIGDYLEMYRDKDSKIEVARLKARTEQMQREVRESNDAIKRALDAERDSADGFDKDALTTETQERLDELTAEVYKHIEDVLYDQLNNLGIIEALDKVQTIEVYNLPENVEGMVSKSEDGNYHIRVNPNKVADKEMLSRILTHEIGHVLDGSMKSLVYSNHPAMRVVTIGGRVTGIGAVARDIINGAKKNEELGRIFKYPLSSEFKFSAERTSEELLAQVFGTVTNDKLRELVKTHMPEAYDFIEGVIDHVKISVSNTAEDGETQSEGQRSDDASATSIKPNRDTRYAFGAGTGENRRASVRGAGSDAKENTRYSATSTVTLADLPEPKQSSKFATSISDAFTNVGTKSWVLGLMTMRQIADRFPKVAAFQKYVKAQEAMTTKTKLHQAMVAEIDHDFTRLSNEEALALSAVMLNATANEFHVDQTFDHESNKHIDRVLAPEFMKARAEFNALTDAQKALYSKVKAKFASDLELQSKLIDKRIIDQYRESLTDKIALRGGGTISLEDASKITNQEKRHELKTQITTLAVRRNVSRMWDDLDHNSYSVSQLQGPYFPLMRFGEHVVVAKSDSLVAAQSVLDEAKAKLADLNQKDENEYTVGEQKEARKAVAEAQTKLNALKSDEAHYLVEFYESETEANNRVDQIQQLFRDDPSMSVRRELRSTHFRALDAAPYAFIKNLENEISKQLPASDAGKIKDAVRDIYIRAMPERAALKSQLGRIKGAVTGAKVAEMRRAIIASGLRNSFNLSRMEHGTELNDALTELRTGRTDEEKRLGDEMAKRMTEIMTATPTSNKVITAMSNLSYTTMLGLSPSFLMLNLLQPWTVSAPIMAARHGFVETGKALTAAGAEVAANMYANRKAGNGFEFDISTLPADEAAFIKSMHEKGAIDITQEHDLGAQATGQTDGWTDKLAHWSSIPAHHTEVVNRIATALAAYRLEKMVDLKKNTSNAAKYAEKVVSETHLDYTSENSPRLMRANALGGLGKLVFQFKKYQQGMIYLTFKHAKDGFWTNTENLSPEERSEARKAFVSLMGAQVAVAGIAATPMTGILAGAAMLVGMFQDKDKDKEYRQRLYAAMKQHLGEGTATLIMKGVPAALLNIDLSNRAGMGDLLNPVKYAQTGNTGQSSVAGYLMALAGPSASLAANYTQAAMDAQSGDLVKAARTIAPRFIQGPMDAYSMANNGMMTRAGNRFMKPSEVSGWDVAMKTVGLNTASMTDVTEARQAMDTAIKTRDAARKSLIGSYAKAMLTGGDLDEIRDRISDFNSRHQERGVRIDQAVLIKARQAEARYERQLRNGVQVNRRDQQLYNDMFK